MQLGQDGRQIVTTTESRAQDTIDQNVNISSNPCNKASSSMHESCSTVGMQVLGCCVEGDRGDGHPSGGQKPQRPQCVATVIALPDQSEHMAAVDPAALPQAIQGVLC